MPVTVSICWTCFLVVWDALHSLGLRQAVTLLMEEPANVPLGGGRKGERIGGISFTGKS